MSLIPHIRPIVFAAVAGFDGGALASRVFRIDPVHAQDTKAVPQLVQAKEFILLDELGRPRGEWKLDSSGEPTVTALKSGRSSHLGSWENENAAAKPLKIPN